MLFGYALIEYGTPAFKKVIVRLSRCGINKEECLPWSNNSESRKPAEKP